jgi:hypothetical protein
LSSARELDCFGWKEADMAVFRPTVEWYVAETIGSRVQSATRSRTAPGQDSVSFLLSERRYLRRVKGDVSATGLLSSPTSVA